METDCQPSISVAVECDRWSATVADPAATCGRAARAALAALNGHPGLRDAEVGVVLSDDARLRLLNRTYRGVDRPTNVLSFPVETCEPDDGAPTGQVPVLLGDVVIAAETVEREAALAGRTVDQHLSHLVVHGVLHLFGHDHELDSEARAMEALETRILASIGVPDPYGATDEQEA